MRDTPHYRWLATLVVAGLGVRLWAIQDVVAHAQLIDPDGYVAFARTLGDGTHPWHWTFAAVTYGEFFKAPLYQLALSVITTQGLAIVTWGLVLHAILNASSIVSMYVIGRALHTARAGLLAAAVYAFWLPNIHLTSAFWQEHLYVPLLLAGFALLGLATERSTSSGRWLSAGAAFGAAALTRSSVLYFLPVAALWLWFRGGERNHRRGAVLFLGAVALITVPYVVALSRAAGRFVPIEDIGSFSLKAYHAVSPADPSITIDRYARNPSIAPTGLEAARFLAADFAADPSDFVVRRVDMARMLMKPAGGSAIEGVPQPTRRAAIWHKARTHLTTDLPFVLVLVLAPVGFAVSRQRTFASLLLIWVLLLTGLLALTMWAGQRFRAPIEPAMIALAAAAATGAWKRPGLSTIGVAGAVFAAVMAAMTINAGPLVRARASYGVEVWPPAPGTATTFEGAAGLRSAVRNGEVALMVTARSPAETLLTVRVDGRQIDTVRVPAGEERLLRYREIGPNGGYVELEARTIAGAPATVSVAPR